MDSVACLGKLMQKGVLTSVTFLALISHRYGSSTVIDVTN